MRARSVAPLLHRVGAPPALRGLLPPSAHCDPEGAPLGMHPCRVFRCRRRLWGAAAAIRSPAAPRVISPPQHRSLRGSGRQRLALQCTAGTPGPASSCLSASSTRSPRATRCPWRLCPSRIPCHQFRASWRRRRRPPCVLTRMPPRWRCRRWLSAATPPPTPPPSCCLPTMSMLLGKCIGCLRVQLPLCLRLL